MSKYTTELRDIEKSGLKVFDFPYVFYDETKKPDFEKKFIAHFFFREIGMETVGRFKHYLKVKCDEVLPYYNMLLKTSLYEYDVKNNYNLTETFTKTNSNLKVLSENLSLNGTNSNTEEITNQKTNTLTSQTEHEEVANGTRNEEVNESGKLDNVTTIDVDARKVSSDTPSGLLEMVDIKNNVYASKAEIEDTLNTNTDKQTTSTIKEGSTTETNTNNVTDDVTATSQDVSSGTIQNNGSVANATTRAQNENDNGSESYTLERIGDIGVDTTPDKLRKHIEIQKILTTVYAQFFDECEDLFMQIF